MALLEPLASRGRCGCGDALARRPARRDSGASVWACEGAGARVENVNGTRVRDRRRGLQYASAVTMSALRTDSIRDARRTAPRRRRGAAPTTPADLIGKPSIVDTPDVHAAHRALTELSAITDRQRRALPSDTLLRMTREILTPDMNALMKSKRRRRPGDFTERLYFLAWLFESSSVPGGKRAAPPEMRPEVAAAPRPWSTTPRRRARAPARGGRGGRRDDSARRRREILIFTVRNRELPSRRMSSTTMGRRLGLVRDAAAESRGPEQDVSYGAAVLAHHQTRRLERRSDGR